DVGCFVFSGRRRHTRSKRDWSSDVCSSDLDITPGTATRLAFTQQPTNTVAGGEISPAVQLSALDPAGNLVPTFTGNVTVALGNKIGRASCRERVESVVAAAGAKERGENERD